MPRKKSKPDPVIKTKLGKVDKLDALETALENLKKTQEERSKLNLKDVQDLRKKFKQTCDKTRREVQKIEQKNAAKKPTGTTRSGARRGVSKQPVYTDGAWIVRGLDAAKEKFDPEELKYLERTVKNYKEVNKLPYHYLKYLVVDVFLDELKSIKANKTKSSFHDRYEELKGRSKSDLMSDIRTSLFTNEQRDYIFGLLQGAFGTEELDNNGDIKHTEINYVNIVMLAEATIRIVKFVHKFETDEETLKFMLKKSREALGLDDYENDDDTEVDD